MPNLVDTTGLDPAAVLETLYLQAQILPEAYKLAEHFQQWDLTGPLEPGEAEMLLKGRKYFGVLGGRLLQLSLSDDESFFPNRYDSANGQGEAARAIAGLRDSKVARDEARRAMSQCQALPNRQCIDVLLEAKLALDVPDSSARFLDTFFLWRHHSDLKAWWDEPNHELYGQTPNQFAGWDMKRQGAGADLNKPVSRTDSEKQILFALVHEAL